ncbi:CGNR zinc finger domain-containing protein [Kribbella sp. NPDC023855]|uniref:CGNR zinc finger domain-containing protein n=1 Tax=Kribbella sp. NPDC023855 TaxID=3154698 RepID=UPI0033FE5F71
MQRQARLVVELINLTVPGLARGRSYQPDAGDLVPAFAALISAEAAESLVADPDAGTALAKLAYSFQPVFTAADVRAAAGVINELLRRYQARPYLTEDVGQPFHLHFHGDVGGVETFGGEFASALALVVDTYGEMRFGVCEAAECDRVYVDLTRNGARRYCSDACSSRAKMTAYRARQARQ